jgi:hypothetical protein
LPDLKVYATQDDIYETLEQLINMATNTNVLEFVMGMVSVDSTAQTFSLDTLKKTAGETTSTDVTKTVVDVITKLLNFKMSDAFTAGRVGDVTTASVNLDNIVSQLGFELNSSLGTVTATIDHANHSISTSGVATVNGESKVWISLNSELAHSFQLWFQTCLSLQQTMKARFTISLPSLVQLPQT